MLFPVIMKRLLCDINRKWVPEKRKQIWKCALKQVNQFFCLIKKE